MKRVMRSMGAILCILFLVFGVSVCIEEKGEVRSVWGRLSSALFNNCLVGRSGRAGGIGPSFEEEFRGLVLCFTRLNIDTLLMFDTMIF